MVVTILSKTDRKPTLGGKCSKQWSKWLFTGLPRKFPVARVTPVGCFPVQNGGCQKLFWTRVIWFPSPRWKCSASVFSVAIQ